MSKIKKHSVYTDGHLNTLRNFEQPLESFYDIFKTQLCHINFFANEKGLRCNFESEDIIDSNSYILNSLGYRTRELDKNNPGDVVVFGCSTSFGMGVPQDQVWTNKFAAIKNLDVINLCIPGTGTLRYFEDAMLYIKTYGKPKNILVLIPDLYRIRFIDDTEYHLATERHDLEDGFEFAPLSVVDLFLDNFNEHKDDYVQIPFDTRKNISPYYGVYRNIFSMFALEMFCNNAGINLFWSTYNNESKAVLNTLQETKPFFTNFIIDNDLLTDEEALINNCHDSHDNEYAGTHNWNYGTDEPWKGRTHPGIHFHTHVAEFFNRNLGVDDEGNLYKI